MIVIRLACYLIIVMWPIVFITSLLYDYHMIIIWCYTCSIIIMWYHVIVMWLQHNCHVINAVHWFQVYNHLTTPIVVYWGEQKHSSPRSILTIWGETLSRVPVDFINGFLYFRPETEKWVTLCVLNKFISNIYLSICYIICLFISSICPFVTSSVHLFHLSIH